MSTRKISNKSKRRLRRSYISLLEQNATSSEDEYFDANDSFSGDTALNVSNGFDNANSECIEIKSVNESNKNIETIGETVFVPPPGFPSTEEIHPEITVNLNSAKTPNVFCSKDPANAFTNSAKNLAETTHDDLDPQVLKNESMNRGVTKYDSNKNIFQTETIGDTILEASNDVSCVDEIYPKITIDVNAAASSSISYSKDVTNTFTHPTIASNNSVAPVVHNEMNLRVLKTKLTELLLMGTREMVHLDYKRELYSVNPTDSELKRKTTEDKGYAGLLKDILAMYNTPEKYGKPFKSVSGKPSCASYIVFGIDYKENVPLSPCPINRLDKIRCFLDENILQDHILSRCTYYISVAYYEILINDRDLVELQAKGINWMTNGHYGLLEIMHDTQGPVFAKLVTDRKSGRSTKNEIAKKLYIRLQARSQLVNRDTDFERECYDKFSPKFSKYENSLDHLKKTIKPSKYFKILISTACYSKQNETFLSNLCRVKWNIVVYASKEKLDEEAFVEILKRDTPLPLTKLYPNEMERQDQGWKNILEEVARQQSCLYLPFKAEDGAEKEKYYLTMENVTNKIFERIELPWQLSIFNLVLDCTTIDNVARLTEKVKKAWDIAKMPAETDEENLLNRLSVFLSHHDSLLTAIKQYAPDADEERQISVVAPLNQLDCYFQSLHEGSRISNCLTLPGSAGKVTISDADEKRMNIFFEFYSLTTCVKWWQSLSSEEEKQNCIQQIRRKFLSGYPIEPNGLYVHKLGHQNVYIKREKMDETCKEVRSVLKKVDRDEKIKNIIRLCHESSAGGTTVGRVALFEICDDYPCVILRNWHENNCTDVIILLNDLYDKCRLPICVLVDTSLITNMHFADVKNFANMVSNSGTEIKIVILFVERFYSQEISEAIFQINLYNKLTTDESKKLDALMEKASSMLENTPFKTLSLYALCQFGYRYRLLESNLKKLQSKTSNDIILLLLSAVIHHYSRQPLPFYFVAKVLGEDPEQFYNNLDEKLDLLGAARDFVLVEESHDGSSSDNYHNGIRPVTSFVSKKILKFIFGEPEEYLILFVNELLQLIDSSRICAMAVTAVSRPLFIQRRVTFEGRKEGFSFFVNDLEKHLCVEVTVNQLELIVNAIGYLTTDDGPHVQAMFARYVAYRKRDVEKALSIMKNVLNVSENQNFATTKSNDSILLTTAGNLISMKLQRMANNPPNNTVIDANIFPTAHECFTDATMILQRAQRSELNCYAFITEARLCYYFLHLYFVVRCQKNVARFTNLLSEGNVSDELKDVAENAHKKLSDLECLLQKHHMEGYDERETEQNISKLKIKLLGLKVDIGTVLQRDFEQMCKSDPWLARGAVDFFLMRYEYERQNQEKEKARFEMLPPQAYASIIRLFQEHDTKLLTRSNYRHIILAMIYSYKSQRRFWEGNLDLAQKFAVMWTKSYLDDNRAHYYLALFSLIRVVGILNNKTLTKEEMADQNSRHIKEMKQRYAKCKELVKDNRPSDKMSSFYKWHPSELHFVIGNQGTLEALIPKDSKYLFKQVDDERDLKIFTGKANSIENAHIIHCDELNCDVYIPKEFKQIYLKYRREMPRYWFVLQTRTNGFYVEKLYTKYPVVKRQK